MRRADRLFQIVQYLRGRRLTTAAQLASWLHVAQRTIYRDIRDLSLSGVPVEGEAGVGYRLAQGFDLPPLMFSYDEIEALTAGARMVESWGGNALANAARSALAKIAAALPPERRIAMERVRLFAPGFHVDAGTRRHMDTMRAAILERRVLRMDYCDAEGRATRRHVWPLGLYFWGDAWTLAAWCELRQDFRNFRLDRLQALEESARTYPDEPGRRLEDFLRRMEAE